jgi:hypothetical protein
MQLINVINMLSMTTMLVVRRRNQGVLRVREIGLNMANGTVRELLLWIAPVVSVELFLQRREDI